MSKRDNQILLEDRKTRDTVARNFEVLGEAVARLSNEFKLTHNYIFWREIKGFRNLLIHSYELIDYSMVWATIGAHLPTVYKQVTDLLNSTK